MSKHTRRQFTLGGLELGSLGLASIATGIPAWFLGSPTRAAVRRGTDHVDPARAQLLVLSTSGAGDPVNANAPGTYDLPNAVHAADPSMAKTALSLGGVATTAAQVWSTLPQWVLDRTAFIHHSTPTQIHPEHTKVLGLWDEAENNEGMPALFTRHLAPELGTLIRTPVSAGAGPVLKANGRTIANQPPTLLRDLLAQPDGPITTLAPLRDATLDKIHSELKATGTKEQRAYLDNVAMSRNEARNLSSDVLGILSEINDNTETGQVLAAIALLKLNLSAAVAIKIQFGRDNHADVDLAREIADHQTGVAAIAMLMERLASEGLQDHVTFAMLNVFGRTLSKKGMTGRDHWRNHHTSVLIGRHVKAGVYGGLAPYQNNNFSDYTAMDINPASGLGQEGGALAFEDTFFGVVKTLALAIGIRSETMDTGMARGQPIIAALA